MVRQHWGPGQALAQLEGFPKYPWAHMILGFFQKDRKVTLALPCLGMDSLSAGLREIPWDGFEVAHAYDIDESLSPTLLHMHGADANLHIGHRAGDVLACNEEEWSRVDWVISGPLCPPFSSIGPNRAPEDDPREAVFSKK
jgi:site-specific DNA-cytosine methylase